MLMASIPCDCDCGIVSATYKYMRHNSTKNKNMKMAHNLQSELWFNSAVCVRALYVQQDYDGQPHWLPSAFASLKMQSTKKYSVNIQSFRQHEWTRSLFTANKSERRKKCFEEITICAKCSQHTYIRVRASTGAAV